jgi:lysophospholipase L1-like esterase
LWKSHSPTSNPIAYNRSRERQDFFEGFVFSCLQRLFAMKIGDAFMNRNRLSAAFFTAAALAGLLAATRLTAQEPGNVPETKAPAPTQSAPQTTPTAAAQNASNYDARADWPWLGRFKDADLALAPPARDENRVVFMGDSITQLWKIEGADGYFPGKPYINRGISGQTTPQMVLRFHQDVIALKPKVVVILGGINDIAGNTGPETLEQIEDNLTAMTELAKENHIRVVLCSVMPAFDFPWRPGVTPAPKVLALNRWIEGYAGEHHYVYVDYHTAMKDERDGLPPNLSKDGVHPTAAGYTIMAPLVEAGIKKALGGTK